VSLCWLQVQGQATSGEDKAHQLDSIDVLANATIAIHVPLHACWHNLCSVTSDLSWLGWLHGF
jgi:hypothetical protein